MCTWIIGIATVAHLGYSVGFLTSDRYNALGGGWLRLMLAASSGTPTFLAVVAVALVGALALGAGAGSARPVTLIVVAGVAAIWGAFLAVGGLVSLPHLGGTQGIPNRGGLAVAFVADAALAAGIMYAIGVAIRHPAQPRWPRDADGPATSELLAGDTTTN